MRDAAARRDIYQELTDEILRHLESGTKPWTRPWDSVAAGMTGPVNASTGRRYRGANLVSLGLSPLAWRTGDPRFVSFKQAEARGWHVRKGARSLPVLFFKRLLAEDRNGRTDASGGPTKVVVPVLRVGHVFHASMVDGIAPYVPPTEKECPWRTPEAVDEILRNCPVPVVHGGDKAAYSPAYDRIVMPPREAFSGANGEEGYCATLLHEMGHSTGHPSRLDRDLGGRFGSHRYGAEELVAELASTYVCAELGLPNDLPSHASYVADWISLLREDKHALVKAAGMASAAADHVLGWHPAYAARMAGERAAQAAEDAAAAGADAGGEPPSPSAEMPAVRPGKPFQHYDGAGLVTIEVPFVPGDDMRARLGRLAAAEAAQPVAQTGLIGGGPR